MRAGLPYKVVGGTRFYERKEIKDALAYLRAVDNPDDTVSLRRIFNVPKRGLGQKAEATLAAHAEQYGISFGQAISDAAGRARPQTPDGQITLTPPVAGLATAPAPRCAALTTFWKVYAPSCVKAPGWLSYSTQP